MSAGAAPVARARWRRDPALLASLVSLVILTALFLAPRPVAPAAPPALRMAVADLRGHALVIVRTDAPGEGLRIPLPGGPHEVLALPDGRLVVSLEQFAALAVVDPRSGDVRTVEVGGIPHGLAVHGDTVYVTDRSVNAVRRFGLRTWEERAPLAVGAWPHIVAVRPDGSLAVANAQDDTVTVGDRVVAVSHVPESIAVGRDGRIATAGAVGGVIAVLDASGRLVREYVAGGRPVRLLYDPEGEVLAAALSADGTVAILERDQLRRIVVGGVPDGLAFSPDSRWLYVSDEFAGTVTVVDLRLNHVVDRFTVAQSAGALLVLPLRG